MVVEIYFDTDDVVRVVDCKCGDAFDTLKAFSGSRIRNGAFLQDNLGVLSRDTMLSDASGNVWMVDGAEKRSTSVYAILIGLILKESSSTSNHPELQSGFKHWFASRPPHSVVPSCATLSPKLLQMREANLA